VARTTGRSRLRPRDRGILERGGCGSPGGALRRLSRRGVNIAFYAPLKPVDHPVPSGDRQLARALLRALAAGRHDVAVASRLRSYDAHGDTARQARIARIGARCAQRLLARWQADRAHPDLWFTYHLHHKAPDWLGPAVCRALDIPYVVAEASIAPR